MKHSQVTVSFQTSLKLDMWSIINRFKPNNGKLAYKFLRRWKPFLQFSFYYFFLPTLVNMKHLSRVRLQEVSSIRRETREHQLSAWTEMFPYIMKSVPPSAIFSLRELLRQTFATTYNSKVSTIQILFITHLKPARQERLSDQTFTLNNF